MTALSDLISQHIPKGMSSRELERQCDGAISRATIDNYRAGRHPKNPDDSTLRIFHELLGIPIRELRAAANKPVGEPGIWAPPTEANLMNQRQRDAVTELIRSFVKTQGAHNAVETTPPSGTSPEGDQAQEGRRLADQGQLALARIDRVVGEFQVEHGDHGTQESG